MRLAVVAASMAILVPLGNAATPTIIGLNFSDGRAFTQMAGKTADGCSNWVDSFTIINNGFHDAGYAGLAYGSTTLADGIITAQWNSATTFSGGAADDAEQQLYYTYLDDGDGPAPDAARSELELPEKAVVQLAPAALPHEFADAGLGPGGEPGRQVGRDVRDRGPHEVARAQRGLDLFG